VFVYVCDCTSEASIALALLLLEVLI
jgi:hypothetical protein